MAARIRDNARLLLEVYRGTAAAIREERAITPAAEWLVDNFHVVEEQIREIRDDLPRGFYRQLPKLADGPLEGYPRVFGIAWAFVAHTDSHFDPQALGRFVQAYQRVQPLTIGELWAVAITLRIVLVENLRRLAARIASGPRRRDAKPTRWPTGCSETAAARPSPRKRRSKGFDRAPLSSGLCGPVGSALARSGSQGDAGAALARPTAAGAGNHRRRSVRAVHQGQGATNVTVRNVITSMRLMSAVDWAEFFESVSMVDAVLRADSDFAAMDFATRDRYRHAIEKLARGSGHTEIEVAQHAIAAARRALPEGPDRDGATARREHDPGYYLISRGLHALEKELGFRAPIRDWIARANAAAGIMGYLGTIAAVSAVILAAAAIRARTSLASVDGRCFILAIVGRVPAMDAAVTMVNRAVTICIGPAAIPALELHDGVPSEPAHDGRQCPRC